MSVADLLHLAFGSVAGITFVALILFAQASSRTRGLPRAIAALAGGMLALLLLLVAASQVEPVLHSLAPGTVAKAAGAEPAASPELTGAALASGSASISNDGTRSASAAVASILSAPDLDPEALLPTFLAFISWTAFLAAAVGGVAAALLAWVTRDESAGEESAEADPLAQLAAESAA